MQSQRIAQPFAVDANGCVVAMERTGTLEVAVTDERGEPLRDVRIDTSPNVHWQGVGSTIFPWGTWHATTDAKGIARVVDLPPDRDLWVSASAKTHQLRRADRDRNPAAVIDSGATTQTTLVLEPSTK
jgi:hypothetical protein